MATSPSASPNTKNKKPVYSDRFIPARNADLPLHHSFDLIPNQTHSPTQTQTTQEEQLHPYSMILRHKLIGDQNAQPDNASPINSKRNLFRYLTPTKAPASPTANALSAAAADPTVSPAVAAGVARRSQRKISAVPNKILDAPALQDDFYLNLVDWSSLNVLAVGLGTCVYLWSACTSKVTKLCDLGPNEIVTSISWSPRGVHLAVGTSAGDVQVWDTVKGHLLRSMQGHTARVGTLCWSGQILSTGSRDRSILTYDFRAPDMTRSLYGHKQEICGLRWSHCGLQLASGGNDNNLLIWSLHSDVPQLRFSDHTAAVKAISWSPHQNGLLASGGGTADRCIRFWNTLTGTPLSFVDTGSQVCNLCWSKNVNEIVSTHGYSQNQVVIWRYPSMTKVTTLSGHTLRVLYLSVSPDGQTIVTGAGDETLRFWNVFPGPKSSGDGGENSCVLEFNQKTSIR